MLSGGVASAGAPAAQNRGPVRRQRSLLRRAVTVVSAAVLTIAMGAVLTLATARATIVPAGSSLPEPPRVPPSGALSRGGTAAGPDISAVAR